MPGRSGVDWLIQLSQGASWEKVDPKKLLAKAESASQRRFFQAYARLDAKEQRELLLAMERPEILTLLAGMNALWESNPTIGG